MLPKQIIILDTTVHYNYLVKQVLPWIGRTHAMPLNRDQVARTIISMSFFYWCVSQGFVEDPYERTYYDIKPEFRHLYIVPNKISLMDSLENIIPVSRDVQTRDTIDKVVEWLSTTFDNHLLDETIGSLARIVILDYKWVGTDIGVLVEYP